MIETTSPNTARDCTMEDDGDFIGDLLKDEMIVRKALPAAGSHLTPGATLTSFLLELSTTYSIHPIIISS